jgi:hypothetical protein
LIADNPNLLMDSRIGQMRSNFRLREYDLSISSASKLLEMEKTPNEIKTESHLTKGKSYLALFRDSLGLKELNDVLNPKGTEMAAEAKYNIAEYYFTKKNHVKSQEVIMDLVNEDPGYDYWITKAFMLLSDNFVAISDNFQAKETLQSIINNSEDNNAVEESKVKLNYPQRGGAKKYHVYVRNPKTKRIMKIAFGDVHGGLTAKVSNPKARKSFAARHNCAEKKDRTKAGYWACRINRYAHLWGGKTYPGFW